MGISSFLKSHFYSWEQQHRERDSTMCQESHSKQIALCELTLNGNFLVMRLMTQSVLTIFNKTRVVIPNALLKVIIWNKTSCPYYKLKNLTAENLEYTLLQKGNKIISYSIA